LVFSVIGTAATDNAAIVPGGRVIAVTLQQQIDSASASPDSAFAATVAAAVPSLAGTPAIPAGSPALVELVSSPGAEAGTTVFTVMLKEITVGGVSYPVTAGWAVLPPAAVGATPAAESPAGVTDVTIKGGGAAIVRVFQGASLSLPVGVVMNFTLGEMLTLGVN